MDARIVGGVVEFTDEGRPCATYHYNDDPHKSFFRGLFTPKGHDVVASPPPEHPHHKGLQYALCTKDVNFWEEKPGPSGLPSLIGSQVNKSLSRFRSGDEMGFKQVLSWWDEVMKETFYETRTISVKRMPASYVWTWHTQLTARRDNVLLIKGPWAAWSQYGMVAYYGLGLRLADAFFKNEHQLLVDQDPTTIEEGLGRVGSSVALYGAGVQVMFEQSQKEPLYVNVQDFVFMTLTPIPTTVDELPLANGATLEQHYVITVGDL